MSHSSPSEPPFRTTDQAIAYLVQQVFRSKRETYGPHFREALLKQPREIVMRMAEASWWENKRKAEARAAKRKKEA